MSKVLAIGEISAGKLKKASKEVTSIGKKYGSVNCVLIGENAAGFAAELASVGADTVYVSDVKDYAADVYAKAIKEIIGKNGYEIILIPHSWTGRDIAGRLGALLDTAVISDAIELNEEGGRIIVKKPVYSGKAFVKLKIKSNPQIITIRPNSMGIEENAGEGKVENITIDISSAKAKITSLNSTPSDKIALSEADIVVSGGRGMKSGENFKILEELADLLKAGVGATRAAVDAEWVDHTLQVGQTGQTVSPNLYIAAGISGAIQHLAGMGSSKNIVAINKDPDAPIFKVATFGIVDDLFKIIPTFTEEVKKIKG
ncbi:MAG: electron transfer flavoprotein subunit alpha/FixB family protein [Spirochaetia bacterium]|nr:electron transfer flavoprotein subunit alpha/FixB family protein [Spirochaetia bacterium]